VSETFQTPISQQASKYFYWLSEDKMPEEKAASR
jgi:hypothetical protein